MPDPKTFHFDLDPARRPAPGPLVERWHAAARRAAPRCTSPRNAEPAASIEAIVIHATAGATSDGAVSVMEAGRASFHWLVPAPREAAHGRFVWATAPEARAAWHVANRCRHPAISGGAGFLNRRSLGVEVVNTQRPDDPFSDWQVASTASIVRYAWAKYPNLRHVVAHAMLDPARRSDPGAHFPWEAFRDAVLGPPAQNAENLSNSLASDLS